MSKAIVAAITQLVEIPGADNIQVAIVLGENVIVSKELTIGDIGIFFPTETQLSPEYCKYNNLFRHSEFNADTTKKGFFDDNRRVRAQPFLKVKSQGLFMPLDSLSYLGAVTIKLGDQFDELNGQKVCEKYISKATRDAITRQQRPKQQKIILTPYFEKHVDSHQFKHMDFMIPKGALLSFHAKIHGTSMRVGYTKKINFLPKWKLLVNKLVPIFPPYTWDYVVGTRNVVLTDKGKEGFHGSEQFRFDIAEQLRPYLEKGVSLYGEICGFVNGKPIMAVHNSSATKDKAFQKKYGKEITYRYNCKEHEYRFHIYRITYLTDDGKNVDFSQQQIDQWCKERLLLGPLEVAPQEIYDGDVEKLRKKVEFLTERPDVLGEDYIDPSHPSEGIIIRVDTGMMTPMFLKNKSTNFRIMEGLCEAVDTEDAA